MQVQLHVRIDGLRVWDFDDYVTEDVPRGTKSFPVKLTFSAIDFVCKVTQSDQVSL